MSHLPVILTSTPRRDAPRDVGAIPRADFELLAERLGGRIVYPDELACRPVKVLEDRARLGLSQAVRARRMSASAYISFSERVGMPLTLTRPAARHVMIAHLLTSPQKRRLAQLTRYLRSTDRTLVFARPQERYLREELGLDEASVRLISDKVDARFFSPVEAAESADYVLSVGREQRDYETLVEALRKVGFSGEVVAGSPWSHRGLDAPRVPGNVRFRQGLSYVELRELYRNARLVVIPVRAGTDYAAGVNGVLEAMACGKPLVASDTPGLEGYVTDGVDGRLVPAGDSSRLASLIHELWHDPTQAERLGRAARATVERERTVEHFVANVAAVATGCD